MTPEGDLCGHGAVLVGVWGVVKRVCVLVLVSAAVGLAGCSSGDRAPSAAGTSPGQPVNGEQTKPASQVLADTKSALFNTHAVHIRGSQSTQGQSQQLDLQFQDSDSQGTITAAGSTVNLVKTGGKIYIKAPVAYWAKLVGPAVAPKLADRWLVQDAGKDPLAASLTLQGIAASLNAEDSPLTPQVTPGTAAGRKIVTLTQQDGSTIAIANTGEPVPLTVTNKGASQGQLSFTGYGTAQPITAPPGAVTAEQAAKAPGAGTA